MARYGSILGIRPEAVAEYKRPHTGVWPEVLALGLLLRINDYIAVLIAFTCLSRRVLASPQTP